jgi:hypothetical protein
MAQKKFASRPRALERFEMEQFNITMRKYLKEVGVTAQQAIERVVREQKLAGRFGHTARYLSDERRRRASQQVFRQPGFDQLCLRRVLEERLQAAREHGGEGLCLRQLSTLFPKRGMLRRQSLSARSSRLWDRLEVPTYRHEKLQEKGVRPLSWHSPGTGLLFSNPPRQIARWHRAGTLPRCLVSPNQPNRPIRNLGGINDLIACRQSYRMTKGP